MTDSASSAMGLWIPGRGGVNRTLGVESNGWRYEMHTEKMLATGDIISNMLSKLSEIRG